MSEKCESVKGTRYCPYCDAEIAEAAFPYCEACEVEVFNCPKCGEAVPREEKTCLRCGADIKEEAAEGG